MELPSEWAQMDAQELRDLTATLFVQLQQRETQLTEHHGPHAALPSLQRGFLEVLQAIRRLLARSKCFRPEREWPDGYLTRGTRVPLSRHTQQPRGKPNPTYCSRESELALCRLLGVNVPLSS